MTMAHGLASLDTWRRPHARNGDVENAASTMTDRDRDSKDRGTFGLRLPRNPVAPSERPMAIEPSDIPGLLQEQIKLLRSAEEERKKNVTRGDLAALSTNLLAAVATTDKKVDAVAQSIGHLQGQLGTQGIAIAAVNDRVAGIDSRVKIIEQIRTVGMSAPPRRMSPMPKTYKPDETSPGGRVAFDKAEWEEMQEQQEEVLSSLQKHEEELASIQVERNAAKAAEAEAKEKERVAQDRQATIAEYAAGLEKKAAALAAEAKKKRARYIKLAIAIAPTLSALGAAAAHYFHL